MIRTWLVVLIGGWASLAHASQLMKTAADRTRLYESPNRTSQVISELFRETPLAASNLSIQGFYKVRTPDGRTGFVSIADVVSIPSDEALGSKYLPPSEAQKREALRRTPETTAEKRSTEIRFFGGYSLMNASDISTVTLFGDFSGAWVLGGEVDFKTGKEMGLAARFSFLQHSSAARDAITSTDYTFEITSIPVEVGLYFPIFLSKQWSLRFDVFGGLGFATQLSSLAGSGSSANQTLHSGVAPTFSGSIGIGFYPAPAFTTFLSLGYRYLRTAQLSPSVTGTGSTIFRDGNGNYIPFSLDMGGIFMTLGLGLAF